jgi:hypothetical protein
MDVAWFNVAILCIHSYVCMQLKYYSYAMQTYDLMHISFFASIVLQQKKNFLNLIKTIFHVYAVSERHKTDHKEIERLKSSRSSTYTHWIIYEPNRGGKKYLATSQQAIDSDQLSIKSLWWSQSILFSAFRFPTHVLLAFSALKLILF